MLPLDFTEDDVVWVTSKLFVTTGYLEVELIDLRNWLIFFGCASEELRVVVIRLDDWITNSFHPWYSYHALMDFRLEALDQRPGVIPMGIGEMIKHDLAKLIMRAAGDQAKIVCGDI